MIHDLHVTWVGDMYFPSIFGCAMSVRILPSIPKVAAKHRIVAYD